MVAQNTILKAQAEAEVLLIQAGCSMGEIAAWKLQNCSQQVRSPQLKQIYESAIPFAKRTPVLQEVPLSPTQLAKAIAARTGKSVSAIAVNKLLVKLGLQEQRQRPSRKYAGKFKNYYALTEAGKKHGVVIVNDVNGNEVTVFQIRWFSTAIELLSSEFLQGRVP